MSQGKGNPPRHRRAKPLKILGCLGEEERRLAHGLWANSSNWAPLYSGLLRLHQERLISSARKYGMGYVEF